MLSHADPVARFSWHTNMPWERDFKGKGLSAGRVQSAAVKILVERERARMRFVSAEWWGLGASLKSQGTPEVSFDASVWRVGGRPPASFLFALPHPPRSRARL